MTSTEKREICIKEFEAQKSNVDARTNADIEKYRKGCTRLVIKDKNGKAVAGKHIIIHQKTHDFKYGANIFMLDEFDEDCEKKAYREIFKECFNLATVPFYWDGLEPEQGKPRFAVESAKVYRRPAPDLCIDYCKENGIDPKLHCLFYDKFIPDWLPVDNESDMRRLYEKRFSEIAERYSGKMYEFEVTNETLCVPMWKKMSILSKKRNIEEWCFDIAKKYFKDDVLVINEGNPLPQIAIDGYKAKYFLLLEKLLAKGTPIDKIGIQNHLFVGATLPVGAEADENEIRQQARKYMNPEDIFKALDKLGEFGLPLEITEVTISTLGSDEEAEELQADILQYLYTIWFSHPLMESIVYWNTVDFTAYDNGTGNWNENNCRGGLFLRNLTPKKSAIRLQDLFNKKWHTDLELVTDENGVVAFRGFYGDYEAVLNGQKFSFGIHKNGYENLEIIL